LVWQQVSIWEKSRFVQLHFEHLDFAFHRMLETEHTHNITTYFTLVWSWLTREMFQTYYTTLTAEWRTKYLQNCISSVGFDNTTVQLEMHDNLSYSWAYNLISHVHDPSYATVTNYTHNQMAKRWLSVQARSVLHLSSV
jgi:hypothetical protein